MSAARGTPELDPVLDPPRHLVREAVERALAEDFGALGDITSALLPVGATVIADLVARAPGVLAGTACVDTSLTTAPSR